MASIRKLPNGRWQAQIRPIPNGAQVTKTSTRKATVQRWLDEQTAAIVTGTYADPKAGRETLRSYFDSWSKRQIWEANTTQAMTLTVRSTTFIDRPLRTITKAHVEEWVKSMQTKPRGTDSDGNPRARGLAAGTIHTRYTNVRSVFRAAVADRKIGADPTLGVRLPKARRAESAMQIPTVDQVRKLLNAAAPEYRALIALCAFAGLRLGEVSALKVGDIDFLKRQIAIDRQVQRANGGTVEIRAPKHGSERTIAAASGLLNILSAHIAYRGLQATPEAWMFPGEHNQPAHQKTVARAWQQAKTKAKVDGFRLHDLRHFYASGLIASGCDISTVQHALGHSSPTVTLSTYTHLWPKAEDRTRAAAQGLVDEVFGSTDEPLTNATTTTP